VTDDHVRRIIKREPATPPHPLSIKVTFDCGHSYTAHGAFARQYQNNDEAVCEYCLKGRMRLPQKIRPHQAGWLRRSDLDTPDYDIWEMPDGGFHQAPPDQEPVLEWLPYVRITDGRKSEDPS
jgi:hypothetical protein